MKAFCYFQIIKITCQKTMLLLTLLQVCLLISESKSTYETIYIDTAIDYLEEYNSVKVKDVGFLFDDKTYARDNDTIIHDLFDRHSQMEESLRFLTTFQFSGNISEMSDKIEKFSGQSVIILPNFETVEDIQKAFLKFPNRLTRIKMWLLLIESNFDSYEEMSERVNYILSRHPNYLSKFTLDSQVYAIVRINSLLELVEIYRVCPNNNISIRKITVLDVANKTFSEYIWEHRKDLRKCMIRVGYMYYTSDVIRPDATKLGKQPTRMYINSGGIELQGYSAQRYSLLQSNLNFSIQWVHVDDSKFGGYDYVNQRWNGIVGMLVEDKIDTAILELSITAKRRTAISYGPPSQPYKTHLFSLKPGPTWSWMTFLDVFDKTYWLMLITFVVGFSHFLHFLFLYSIQQEKKTMSFVQKVSQYIRFFSLSLRAFAALDVSDSDDDTWFNMNSKRLLVIVICFCGAINFYVYNAGLISYLMVQENLLRIDELSDILSQPGYKLLVNEGSSDEAFLKYSRNPVFEEVLKKTKEENGMFSTYEEGEERLLDGDKMVLFGESPSFEVMSSSYPCQVAKSTTFYNFNFAAFPFQKESPYIPLFTYAVNKMMENGLMTERLNKEKENMECEEESEKYFRTLSYKDVISAFAVFVAGSFLAFGYCIIEWIYKIFQLSRKRTSTNKDLLIHYRKFQLLKQKLQVLIVELEKEYKYMSFRGQYEENEDIKIIFHEISQGYQDIINYLKGKYR